MGYNLNNTTRKRDTIAMAAEALSLAAGETTLAELCMYYSIREVNQIERFALDLRNCECVEKAE